MCLHVVSRDCVQNFEAEKSVILFNINQIYWSDLTDRRKKLHIS